MKIIIFTYFAFISICLLFAGSHYSHDGIKNTMILSFFSYNLGLVLFYRLCRIPKVKIQSYVFPVYFLCLLVSLVFITVFRIEYSIKLIIVTNFIILIFYWIICGKFLNSNSLTFYLIPSKRVSNLKNYKSYNFFTLEDTSFPNSKYDGFIVDFNDQKISSKWKRFIIEANLKKIPVYSYDQTIESLSGQVDLNLFEEHELFRLQQLTITFIMKRIIDIFFVLSTLPIIIPLCLCISLAILIDSPGDILFRQVRIGLNGQPFSMIKFRSMISKDTTSETELGDQRVTVVGAMLRRYRLDDFPKFINILKGDMRLIGPRPETRALVEDYDKKIPFFMCRHAVKPGISGWAQVMLGYTVGADEKRIKLAYDLYYIKHYSLWLDLLIWFKTIKIIFTGSGAR